MATVSAAILSYNRPDYLKITIESVLAQTRQPNEIIVFDNGSCESVSRLVSKYSKQKVIFRGAEETREPSWNFERAVTSVSGEYVLLLHDDDVLLPNFFERQVGFLEKFPDAAGVACNFVDIDSNGNEIKIPRQKVFNEEIKWFKSSAEVATVYAEGGYLLYPTVVYKSSFIRETYSKDLDKFGKVADVVILCELANKGPVAYQNIVLYQYRRHPGQESSIMPYLSVNKLNDYLFSIKTDTPNLAATLKANIRIRSTSMTMDLLRTEIKKNAIKALCEVIKHSIDRKFSLLVAAKYINTHFKNKYIYYHIICCKLRNLVK